MRGIHRWPVNSPHKGPVTQKTFPFDDVIVMNREGRITHTSTNESNYINQIWVESLLIFYESYECCTNMPRMYTGGSYMMIYYSRSRTWPQWGLPLPALSVKTCMFASKTCSTYAFVTQSLDTDMQRLFYSTWPPPSFSSHIKGRRATVATE